MELFFLKLASFAESNPAFVIFGFFLLFFILCWIIRHFLSGSIPHNLHEHITMIVRSHAEMQGRLEAMTRIFDARQQKMNDSIHEKFDTMTGRIGETLNQQTRSTWENLSKIQERLVAIDSAQNNIQSLASQMVQLQSILSNKQTRGAFGQARMEAIIQDALPSSFYEFQATLSNGTRPDCLVRMPNETPALVIDAKFPLEAWNSLRSTSQEEERKYAKQMFRRDMETHIRTISEKYLIAGETQEMAFLFVPSESVFSEIHENFEDIIQRAHRFRIVIVSPSLLMLSIQIIQAILKDAQMQKETHLICNEVFRLVEDVERLDDRIRKLNTHFKQVSGDIDDALISSTKIKKRGKKIHSLDFRGTKTKSKIEQDHEDL